MGIKKIISFVLVLAMVFSYAPKNVMAANDKVTISFTYKDKSDKEIHPEEKVEFDKDQKFDVDQYKKEISGYTFDELTSKSSDVLKGIAAEDAEIIFTYETTFKKVDTEGDKITVRYHYREMGTEQKLIDTVIVSYDKGASIEFTNYAEKIPGYNYVKNHEETFAKATNEDGSMDIYMYYEQADENTESSGKDVKVTFEYFDKKENKEISPKQTEVHKEGAPLEITKNAKEIPGYEYIKDHGTDEKAVYGQDGTQIVRMNYEKNGEKPATGDVKIIYRYLDADTNEKLQDDKESRQNNGEELEVTKFRDNIEGYVYIKDKAYGTKVDGGSNNEQIVEMKYGKTSDRSADSKDDVEITYLYLDKDTEKEINPKQTAKQKNGEVLEVTAFVKEIPGYEYQTDKPVDGKVTADENNKQTVKMNYKLVDPEAAKKNNQKASVLFQYVDDKGNVLKEERKEFAVGEKVEADKFIKVIDNYVYDGNTKNLEVAEANNKLVYKYTRKTGTEVVKTKETSNTRKPVSIQKFLPRTGTQRGIAILVAGVIVVVLGTLLMKKKK